MAKTKESLRDVGDSELLDQLAEAKEELFNLRFQGATGQLENHGRLRAVRKDIARIYTEMRERELGIGSAPAKPAQAEKTSEKASDKKAGDKKAGDKEADKKSAAKKAEKAEAK